jgi:hypothetical protein
MMEKIKNLEVNYNHLFDQREKLINQLKNFIRDNGEKIEKLTRQIPEKESTKVLKNALDLFNSHLSPKNTEKLPEEKMKAKEAGDAPVTEPEKKDMAEFSKSDQPARSFFDEIE